MRTGKSLACATVAIFALTPAFCQQAFSLPPWLESYPGATPTVQSSGSLVESRYTTAAQPDDIVEHYRKLFEGAGLSFHSNSDGLGTSIRAEARECDLLIQIRSQSEGALVNVNCAAKTEAASPYSPTDIKVITSRPQSPRAGAGLLAAASRNRSRIIYPFLFTLAWTGMRSDEARTLRWQQVNFGDNPEIRVGASKTKKGEGRPIPMSGRLQAVLEVHAAWYAEKLGPVQPDWYVFPRSSRLAPRESAEAGHVAQDSVEERAQGHEGEMPSARFQTHFLHQAGGGWCCGDDYA